MQCVIVQHITVTVEVKVELELELELECALCHRKASRFYCWG